MWLINITTLQLEEFQTCPKGQYAILSHRWEEDEVSFDDFMTEQCWEQKGFWKIQKCCQQAKLEGLRYVWVDTCCIDKRSSSELSEAVNSMYSWYAQAAECYVYLSDVVLQDSNAEFASSYSSPCNSIELTPVRALFLRLFETADETISAPPEFHESAWFTRGWTLQELIAPQELWFFDKRWNVIGHKNDLAEDISKITTMDEDIIRGITRPDSYSIAQRMSWAAMRTTTRIEDIAYCLLGIFDVNMPLLYGEGNKAFVRLQECIIQHSDDMSIFAWTGVDLDGDGLLARHPSAFMLGGHIVQQPSRCARSAFSMTNRGLAISCKLFAFELNTYLVPIECQLLCPQPTGEATEKGCALGIYVCRTETDDQYRRIAMKGYEFGITTFEKSDVSSKWSGASYNSCKDRCLKICTSKCVPWYIEKMLYIPQSHKSKLTIRGHVQVRLAHLNVIHVLDNIPRTCSESELKEEKRLDFLTLLENEFGEISGSITTNASIYQTEQHLKMLWIHPCELNEGIFINIPESYSSVRHVRIGFNVDFRPICFIFLHAKVNQIWGKSLELPALFNSRNGFLGLGTKVDTEQHVEDNNGALIFTGDRLSGISNLIKVFTDPQKQKDLVLYVSLEQSGTIAPVWLLTLREEWHPMTEDSELHSYFQHESIASSDSDLVADISD